MDANRTRARIRALQEFFESPPPRRVEDATGPVHAYWREYTHSVVVARRVVEGIIAVPFLIFATSRFVQLASGTAHAQDVIGEVLGIALGVGVFMIVPLRLFFRAIARRNEARMTGVFAGAASWVIPQRVEAIMHRGGRGPAHPGWETWLWLPERSDAPVLRVVLARQEDQPPPERVFVVEAPDGDVLVAWEPGPFLALLGAEQRRRSLPGA